MELHGERTIPLPRAQVWAALNDADVLRVCIPGCKSLKKISDTSFAARVTSKIGPVSAAFSGTVELTDIVPGEAYTISGSGQGGVAGFAKGRARVTLGDDGPAAAILTYKATADIGGKLASVGGRLLEGVARKTADQFFDAFVAHLRGDEVVSAETLREEGSGAKGRPAAAIALGPSPAGFPGLLRIEVGEIRITHQLSPLALFAILGCLVAIAALLWRGAH